MGKGASPVTGYKYFLGIHMGISRGPVDELVAVKVGDKMAWEGSIAASGDVQINKPELFGGDKQEGGIVGTLKVMMGEATQQAPASLVAMLGHALPGFRRMMTCFFDGQTSSNSAYPKAWKFRVRRTSKGWQGDACWYPEKVKIALKGEPYDKKERTLLGIEHGDGGIADFKPVYDTTTTHVIPDIFAMNPAHMIYECLTNREWGRGLDPSLLDISSFTQAADTLYEEGFGLCMRWTRRDTLDTFVQSVLDHICATTYADRETGLIKLKLIRKDYDYATLTIYDTDSGILQITENEVSAQGPAINEIVVEYTDPISGDTRTKNAQNLASLQASRGVFNSIKKTYPGLPTVELASRVAQRDLRINAFALRRFTIEMDRAAWRLSPGDVFRLRDVARGIQDMVVRVGRVEDGTLSSGKINVSCVQDVFAMPLTAYTGNQPPGGYKPVTQPILGRHRAFEVPYFLLKRTMKPSDFAFIASDAGYLGTVAEKPTDLSLGYTLYVKSDAPTPDDNPTF